MTDDIIKIVFGAAIIALFVCAIVNRAEEQEQLEICFKQELRTKDCEYRLWKYENRRKTSTVAVPVFINH